jgi:hypothetical protein
MRRKTAIGYLVTILLSASVVFGLVSIAAAEQKMPAPQDQMMQPAANAALQRPDLIISEISFSVVQNTTWGTGTPCQIYNLFATVKNQGKADAKAFNVLIERNKGANGAFEVACQACLIPVAGLGKGASMKLDARQFNNCGDFQWNKFRVTADPSAPSEPKGKVAESNEGNNWMTKTYGMPHISPQPMRHKK